MTFALEIVVILTLVIANGVFAMAEIAVVSSRKSRLQSLADDGDRRARAVLTLKALPDRFLSTVQVGITLIGIIAGAYGGAKLAGGVKDILIRAGVGAEAAGEVSFILVVAFITFLSVILGELVPKQLALTDPERWARILAGPMRLLATAAAPVIWMLTRSSNLMLAILRIKRVSESALSEDEIKVILEEGAQSGALQQHEHELVEGVMYLADRRANSLMTPRTRIAWLDVNAPFDENLAITRDTVYGHFPVCDGTLDHVLGVVSIKDLWVRLSQPGAPKDMRAYMVNVAYVPETMPALKLLESFKQSGRHIALVVDEYGGLSGLVTLHDVMEGIVGDMPAAGNADAQAVRRDDGSWLLDGMLSIDDLADVLSLSGEIPEERDYNTLAGFLLSRFGRIPRRGEHVEWGGYRFEVVDLDAMRIDQVLAVPLPPSPAPPQE